MEKFTVGGVEFSLSRQQVEERLSAVEPEPVRELGVTINGTLFPVKQALAVATGFLRGNFTSHEAMRVFRRLAFSIGSATVAVQPLPARSPLFVETEELLCPDCHKPYFFKTVSPTQCVFEGCSCELPKTLNFPPGAIMWTVGGDIWFLRVPKDSPIAATAT